MLQVYLPVAELSVDFSSIVIWGVLVGIISGAFGVGGGFIMTPILIFLGIPVSVAASTQATQVLASSFSAIIPHFRKNTVDIKMAMVTLLGGFCGSFTGVWIFHLLSSVGYISIVVQLCYIVSLMFIGMFMCIESVMSSLQKGARNHGISLRPRRNVSDESFLPFQVYFEKSGIRISIIPPVAIGFVVALLGSIMGIGGSFILLPAMIYLLHIPHRTVIGTSLMNIVVVSFLTTISHAIYNKTVDGVLAIVLMVTSVIGSQIGIRIGQRIMAEHARVLLSIILLVLASVMVYSLFAVTEYLQLIPYDGTNSYEAI